MAEEENYTGFLQRGQDLTAAHEESLKSFFEQCSPICRDYEESKQNDQDDSFNVFYLVSDLYYRENFHSDIIAFLLDTTEKHGDGNKFLSAFISLLQSIGCKRIEQEYYKDAIAVREKENRIDILVMSKSSKRAIIIENKINNAGDMSCQLPRYYDYVTDKLKLDYQVDAIVYLPLTHGKIPDQTGWTEDDKSHILPLLKIIPAYDKSHYNIVDNWLRQLESLASNVDVLSMIRQYSRLIKHLSSNVMDTKNLERFYNEIKEGDNLKVAQSVRNMLNDLPSYLALRIFDKYRNNYAPFSKLFLWHPDWPVFEGSINNLSLKINIICKEEGYDVNFSTPEINNSSINVYNKIVESVESLRSFNRVENTPTSVTKHFDYLDESGLIIFLDNVLNELAKLTVHQSQSV